MMRLLVGHFEVALHVEQQDAVGRGLDQRAVNLFTLLQPLSGEVIRRDIEHQRQHAEQAAVRRTQGDAVPVAFQTQTVLGERRPGKLAIATAMDQRLDAFAEAGMDVFWQQQTMDALADDFARLPAEQRLGAIVPLRDVALTVPENERQR